MKTSFDLREFVVPVVDGRDGMAEAPRPLGTAFFVAPGVVMSAHHVLSVRPDEGHTIQVLDPRSSDPTMGYRIADVFGGPGHDVAIARVPGWPFTKHLVLRETAAIDFGDGIRTIEYSPTGLIREGTTPPVLDVSFRMHHGWIERMYSTDFQFQAPTAVLDLSFPVLRGGSGAPVIHGKTREVLGLVSQNVDHQLPPAQTMLLSPLSAAHEPHIYSLPQAIAVSLAHLFEVASSSGLMPTAIGSGLD
jgi:hypothetical protein